MAASSAPSDTARCSSRGDTRDKGEAAAKSSSSASLPLAMREPLALAPRVGDEMVDSGTGTGKEDDPEAPAAEAPPVDGKADAGPLLLLVTLTVVVEAVADAVAVAIEVVDEDEDEEDEEEEADDELAYASNRPWSMTDGAPNMDRRSLEKALDTTSTAPLAC